MEEMLTIISNELCLNWICMEKTRSEKPSEPPKKSAAAFGSPNRCGGFSILWTVPVGLTLRCTSGDPADTARP